MFSTLAKFASRFRIPILIIWVALAVSLFILAPSLSKVGVTDDSQFLPKDTESTQAQDLLNSKFASSVKEAPGTATIVIYNQNGLSAQNQQEGSNLHDWLLSKDAPPVISSIISTFDNPALQASLVSQDQTSMIIYLNLSVSSSSAAAKQAVKDIRAHVQSQHPTAQIYLTGGAGISNDLLTSIQQTIDKATLVTVILVIILLLLIYRSPVAMLVPLITIGIAYIVSRGLAGYIASSGVNVSSLVDAYLVVTLFGIGTDYCLFMVSRFKEEITHNDRQVAAEMTLKRIGPVILASATTVIVALLCLGISRFGMNRTSGFMLALGVAVTLAAGLTLTPALISLFGKRLLWPAKLQFTKQASIGFWTRMGRRITKRPAWFALPIIVLLALPYIALPGINTSANILIQMPQSVESVQGFNTLKTHFPPGQLGPTFILIASKNSILNNPNSLKAVAGIGDSLKTIPGVSQVEYFSAPANHLLTLSQQSRSAGDAATTGNTAQLTSFKTLGQVLQDLAVQYTGVTQSQSFQQAASGLTQISTLSGQLQSGTKPNQAALLTQIQQLASGVADNLQSLSGEFNLQVATPFTTWLRTNYFSTDGTLTKINVILNSDPYSNDAATAINQIRNTLGKDVQVSTLQNATYYVGGTTASQTDIIAINDTDFIRVLILAIIGILLVTILLIRSIFAPLYMVATVLFNFGATLGISTWLFLDVLKQNSIIYMLPIFVFVILVAVGSDYNIFLVSRIREESHTKSLKDAICTAISNTGGVITSCGIILAGTFATLTTASLQLVFQVGAAIGIGVLIDTFLVRAIVIPSLATLAGKWNWWPSRLFHQSDPGQDKTKS